MRRQEPEVPADPLRLVPPEPVVPVRDPRGHHSDGGERQVRQGDTLAGLASGMVTQ